MNRDRDRGIRRGFGQNTGVTEGILRMLHNAWDGRTPGTWERDCQKYKRIAEAMEKAIEANEVAVLDFGDSLDNL